MSLESTMLVFGFSGFHVFRDFKVVRCLKNLKPGIRKLGFQVFGFFGFQVFENLDFRFSGFQVAENLKT